MTRPRPTRCAHPTGLPVAASELRRVLGGFIAPGHSAPLFIGSVVGISAIGPVEVWATSDYWFVWLYDPARQLALARGRLGDVYDPPVDDLKLFVRIHAKPGLFSTHDSGCGLGVCLYMGAAVAAHELSGGPLAGIYSQDGDRTDLADAVWASLWRRGLSEIVEAPEGIFNMLSARDVLASGNFLPAAAT